MNALTNFTVALVLLFWAIAASAQSTLTLSSATVRPSVNVTVTGAQFGDSEAVDVYVDTVDTLLLVSTGTGTFTASVTIPASAIPGTHYFTAIGRHSGDAAQTAVKVTTPWLELGYGAAHRSWNPYENVLSPSNVSTLGVLWEAPSNGLGTTPAVNNWKAIVGTNAGLKAYSTTSGALLWTAYPSTAFYASPAQVGNTIYIGDGNASKFYALSAITGAQIWATTISGACEASAVVVAISCTSVAWTERCMRSALQRALSFGLTRLEVSLIPPRRSLTAYFMSAQRITRYTR